ncbi:MAG: RIP metalloprotease RseP [Spirochaetales bacterium]|nr:RIP metalloprotease RseP [Spirochaetales bacterium]
MSYYLTKLSYLIIGFLGISLVLLIHETGHFLAARLMKVEVDVFSLGMGPKLISFKGRRTELRISLIPFGGYCSMKGSTDLTKALKDDAKRFSMTEQGSFFGTTPLARFFIFLAGPLSNLILSIILFGFTAIIPVETIVHDAKIVPAYLYQKQYSDVIEQKELKMGDIILSLNGTQISSWEEAEALFLSSEGKPIDLVILRDGEIINTRVQSKDNRYGIALYEECVLGRVLEGTPFKVGDKIVKINGYDVNCSLDIYENSKGINDFTILRDDALITITYDTTNLYPFAWQTELVKKRESGFFEGIFTGFSKTKKSFVNTVDALLNIVRRNSKAENEITGTAKAASSIGSITMLGMKTSFSSGFRAFLYLLSIVSISICVANLLPIPSFDGGQMLINLIQIITRKEMTPRAYIIFHILGLICTALIMLSMYMYTIRSLLHL